MAWQPGWETDMCDTSRLGAQRWVWPPWPARGDIWAQLWRTSGILHVGLWAKGTVWGWSGPKHWIFSGSGSMVWHGCGRAYTTYSEPCHAKNASSRLSRDLSSDSQALPATPLVFCRAASLAPYPLALNLSSLGMEESPINIPSKLPAIILHGL